MALKEYNSLLPTPPRVDVTQGDSLLDPVDVHINKALGSFAAIPPYFIGRRKDIFTEAVEPYKVSERLSTSGIVYSVMPLKVRRINDGKWFTFPLEPLVSISGKNIIVRRNVAKSKASGTIKEYWSQDDYEVTIQGVLTSTNEALYPEDDAKSLLALFNERQSVEVAQDVLLIFGIKYLAIESISAPHTKGVNNQNFEIKAYSDNSINLLIPL